MTLYKNKYRSETHRLVGRDYSQEGVYFITICCEGKICFLGDVQENEVILNDWGKIVEEEVLLSIEKRTDWAFHQWVIMPNHLHFLIEIVTSVDTHCSAYLQQQTLHRKPRSISSFVAVFKSSVTKRIRKSQNYEGQKIWQNNYHDHIVRNQDSFNKIYNYIGNNPMMWQKDKFYM
ncbi:MAG: transposase [Raineya sp.]|jgi:REP element-mobilizing transposase RayT|nr:transposase [Raineya sp.]